MSVLHSPPLDADLRKRPGAEPTGIGWVLLAVAFALPWLVPIHADPWTTFHAEWMAAALVSPLLFGALRRGGGPWPIDAAALVFAAAAAVPLVQALGGLLLFPAEAPVVSLYLIGGAAAVAVGHRMEQVAPGRLPDALFAGVGLAAFVTVGLVFAQWTGAAGSAWIAPPAPGGRPAGNIGQPNHAATLLVWGLLAVWWAFARKRIGGWVAVAAAVMLLSGVALTYSRTGWLLVGLLVFAALLAHRRLGTTGCRAVFLALGLAFALAVMFAAAWVDRPGGAAPITVEARASVGKRPEIWSMMFETVLRHPWLGLGWNQGRLAQQELLPAHAGLEVSVQHAHNVILDLVVWNGIPLGLAFAAALAWWFVRLARRARGSDLLLLAVPGALLTHAMLELPHVHAYFILPAALAMGILNRRLELPALLAMPQVVGAAVGVALVAALAAMADDYLAIEADLRSYRLRLARVGTMVVPPSPQPRVLIALNDALLTLRTQPRAGMDAQELDRIERTVRRYPVSSALLMYAHAAALNGRPGAAREALQVLAALHPQATRDAARGYWSTIAEGSPAVAAIGFPADR